MNSSSRGKIHYAARAKQLHDFSGLSYGAITPTDIDGFIDFGGIAFALIEVKFADAPLPYGQRLALENAGKSFTLAGKFNCVIIARHNVADTSQTIEVSDCIVSEAFYFDAWLTVKPQTVREFIDRFLITAGLRRYLNRMRPLNGMD